MEWWTLKPKVFTRLKEIIANHPALTYKARGYDEIKYNELSEEDLAAHKEVEEILRTSITGFVRFQNFNPHKDGSMSIRLQYNYKYDGAGGIPFTGVGYLEIEKLSPTHNSNQES